MGDEKPKVGEVKKPNLLQISEEDSNRPETPDVSINLEGHVYVANKKPKNELNFHELWAHSHWRQFTSLMPGEPEMIYLYGICILDYSFVISAAT